MYRLGIAGEVETHPDKDKATMLSADELWTLEKGVVHALEENNGNYQRIRKKLDQCQLGCEAVSDDTKPRWFFHGLDSRMKILAAVPKRVILGNRLGWTG